VRAVKEAGYAVSPIPGCCAFVAALSASGMPSDRFSFIGFLSAKTGARVKALEQLSDREETLIFYESTHRIVDSLKDMQSVFGDQRMVGVAREITKTFETIHSAPIAELIEWMLADTNQQRGEFVVMVEGAVKEEGSLNEETLRVLKLLADELPPKKAAAIASEITGVGKKELYQQLIS